jgi:hypothetical protein
MIPFPFLPSCHQQCIYEILKQLERPLRPNISSNLRERVIFYITKEGTVGRQTG